MNNKGQMKINWWLVLIVVVGAYIVLPGFKGFVDGIVSPAAQPAAGTTGAAQAGVCTLDATPTLTVSAFNFYNKATTLSPDYIFWVDGVQSSDVASPLDSVAGVDYTILANNSGYYNAVLKGMTKCQANEPIEIKQVDKGSLSVTYYNSDDQPATDQTIGADDIKTVSVKLAAPNDGCYGNPQASTVKAGTGLVVAFNYNTTLFDSVTVEGATKTAVPQQGTGTYDSAYLLPIASLCDLAEQRYKLTLDTKTSGNPGTSDNPTGIVYDTELYIESKTGVLTAGIEDTDGVDVGQADQTFSVEVA